MEKKISVHNMNLDSCWFDKIKEGSKTIEMRLNDERRQSIQIGDEIIFTNNSQRNRHIRVRVINIHRFDSFKELYEALPLEKCGYTKDNVSEAKPEDMERYYSKEQQKKYGVLGIEIIFIEEQST